MSMTQHLSLSGHTCHSLVVPLLRCGFRIAAIRASRSILLGRMTAVRDGAVVRCGYTLNCFQLYTLFWQSPDDGKN
jgi:hypothetical protein